MFLSDKYSQIEIIDNTIADEIEDVYNKGYTELYRQTIPNQGTILKSRIFKSGSIYFYEYGVISSYYGKFIKNSSIIIHNDKLVLPGILATRRKYTPTQNGILLVEDMEYLQVLFSSVPNFHRGDIVVIGGKQGHKINYDINGKYTKLVFIQPQAVYLIFNRNGVMPGPDFYLVEEIKGDENYFYEDEKKQKLSGMLHGTQEQVFFDTGVLSLRLNGHKCKIINKKNVYAKSSYG